MCLLPERGIGIVALSDANDNAGGNIRFFDLVGGAVSVAIGGTGQPMDDACNGRDERVDVLYASALLLAVSPLLLTGRWRRRLSAACRGGVAPIVRARSLRPMLLVRGVLLHVALPLHPGASFRLGRSVARPADVLSRRVDGASRRARGCSWSAGAVRLAAAVTLRNDEQPAFDHAVQIACPTTCGRATRPHADRWKGESWRYWRSWQQACWSGRRCFLHGSKG